MTTATTQSPPSDRPQLPVTISEYAAYHGISITTVKKWVKQNRIPSERRGGGAVRAATILIHTLDLPPRAAPGTLTVEQRKAWNKGRRGKPATA